jgi:hypothetical protein
MMNVELLISSVSALNAFLNTIALVFIYQKFLKNMRGLFCTLRADELGRIEVLDLLKSG